MTLTRDVEQAAIAVALALSMTFLVVAVLSVEPKLDLQAIWTNAFAAHESESVDGDWYPPAAEFRDDLSKRNARNPATFPALIFPDAPSADWSARTQFAIDDASNLKAGTH